jgi:hypothetical protein
MEHSSKTTGRDRSGTGHGTTNGTGHGTGQTGADALAGHVGTAAQTVNATALHLEADAALAAAPVDLTGAAPAAATGPSPDDMAAGYSMLAGATLGTVCEMACPAWEITDDEKNDFAAALGKACALWFPGDIPEKWVALIVVAGVGSKIVAARRDPRTGGLKPRFRTVTIKQPPTSSPPIGDPHAPPLN